MEVSVENTGTLGRRMTVQIPAEQIDQAVKSRLHDLTRTVRIPGFRPGKVPIKVVEKKFGGQIRQEVVGSLVRSTLDEALAQQQIEPAGRPNVELPGEHQVGQALEYIAIFDVYPEVESVVLGDDVIERPVVEISDDDVTTVLERLRKQRASWDMVERSAVTGDRLLINYEGTIDGEAFPGGQGEKVQMELGSESVVDGFDEQLIGISAGESRTVTVVYPKDIVVQELAGKEAKFDVAVLSVHEPNMPELDDTLAANFGVSDGGIEALKEEVRGNMGREKDQALGQVQKNRVFDVLIKNNEIEIPASVVEEEKTRLVAAAGTQAVQNPNDSDNLLKTAQRRVLLGLIVTKVVTDNNIEVNHERVREVVESLASTYEEPGQVVAWYYDNPEQLKEVQSAVLEDQVVDWLMGQFKVQDKPMSFDELMQLRQSSAG